MLPKICKIVLYNMVKHGLHVCLEQEVECDAQAGELEEVGEHGDRGEILEVPDADQEQQGHQHPRHVHAVVSVGGGVRVPEHRLQHLWRMNGFEAGIRSNRPLSTCCKFWLMKTK